MEQNEGGKVLTIAIDEVEVGIVKVIVLLSSTSDMEKEKSFPPADTHFQFSAKVKFQIWDLFREFSASTARLLDSFSMSDADYNTTYRLYFWKLYFVIWKQIVALYIYCQAQLQLAISLEIELS